MGKTETLPNLVISRPLLAMLRLLNCAFLTGLQGTHSLLRSCDNSFSFHQLSLDADVRIHENARPKEERTSKQD